MLVPLRYPRQEEHRRTWQSGRVEHGRGFWLTHCERFLLARRRGFLAQRGDSWLVFANLYFGEAEDSYEIQEWIHEVGLEHVPFPRRRDALEALSQALEAHPISV